MMIKDGRPAPTASTVDTGRLHGIDALRGFAALVVVLWHWQHMFWPPSAGLGFVRDAQPAYGLLWPFYDAGWMAVDLFFCISGFVFFSLYKEKIEARKVTASRFALFRLSRLYPLHLATLLLVAGLQWIYATSFGSTFVYGLYDPLHFVLNLVMLNGFSLAGGESFNGPSWSLSVEMFLYTVFFCAALAGGLKTPLRVAGLIVLGILVGHFDKGVGRGLVSFFAGGVVYFIIQRWRAPNARTAWMLAGGLVVAWAALLLETRSGWLERQVVSHLPHALASLEARGRGLFLNLLISLALFPATVIVVVWLETLLRGFWRRTSWLGDLSYSAYLLHFPLQILIIFSAQKLGVDRHLLTGGAAMLAFLVVLYGLAGLSHYLFERPAQDVWRRVALARKAA